MQTPSHKRGLSTGHFCGCHPQADVFICLLLKLATLSLDNVTEIRRRITMETKLAVIPAPSHEYNYPSMSGTASVNKIKQKYRNSPLSPVIFSTKGCSVE